MVRAAQAAGLAERTLRRRLTEQGTSFEAIVASTRVALAQPHRRRGDLTTREIASLVGSSDVSALHRFDERETGQPPRRG